MTQPWMNQVFKGPSEVMTAEELEDEFSSSVCLCDSCRKESLCHECICVACGVCDDDVIALCVDCCEQLIHESGDAAAIKELEEGDYELGSIVEDLYTCPTCAAQGQD